MSNIGMLPKSEPQISENQVIFIKSQMLFFSSLPKVKFDLEI